MTDQRVMVFIDGSNLYHSLRTRFGRTSLRLDAFVERLVAGRRLVRAYYYNAVFDPAREPQKYDDQQRFLYAVENLPHFEVHTGRLVYQPGWPDVPPYEKGIDVRIGTDMVIHSFRRNADIAILVSGDTDYADALQAVKDNGVVVEVALFGGGSSSEVLRKAADAVREIDPAFLEGCWR